MTKEIIVDDNKEIMKDSIGNPIIFEVDPGYEVGLIELPGEYDVEGFFKNTKEIDAEVELVSKPFPNEHACRHAAPSKFERFRSGSRNSGGKSYRIIYGKVRGSNRWEEASYRYNKSVWSADEARRHCKSHGGIAFEAAVAKTDIGIHVDEMGAAVKTLEGGVEKTIEFDAVVKKDNTKHLVFGVVLEPNIVDLQGDVESEEEIQLAAHRFMYKMWTEERGDMVGSEHSRPIMNAIPVQSFLAPIDFHYPETPKTDEYLVRKGSWVLVTFVENDEEFSKVRTGEYRGYSVQGTGKRRALQ